MAPESEPKFGDPYGNRGRTVFFLDDDHQHWMCQDFVCRHTADADDALHELRRGSRVSLHLDDVPIDDLRAVIRTVDSLSRASFEVWWVEGSLVIISPPDAPPPMPTRGRGPGDPAGDRVPRVPILPLGSGAIDRPASLGEGE